MRPSRGVVELAIDEARQSPHRVKVGAVIYDKTYRLGWGHNEHLKTHPRSPHPYSSIHAEFAAVLHAVSSNGRWDTYSKRGPSLYVHRLKLDYTPGLAKPCVWCQQMLAKLNIKDIYWSE